MSSNIEYDYKLTRNFLQVLAEDKDRYFNPIVQILENYPVNSDPSKLRLQLSDGVSYYFDAYLKGKALKKFGSYGMGKHNCIIKILYYKLTKILKKDVDKIRLIIYDFDLLEKKSPIFGNPKTYIKNSEQHSASENNKEEQKPAKRARFSIPIGTR
uniref:DUF2326 domain-containing protein n=1 Tax=Strongyloides papillosus TaxID=174720 RepID=A0A0N5CGM3_STREA